MPPRKDPPSGKTGRKPSFDTGRGRPAKPSAGWVYRSDEMASGPARAPIAPPRLARAALATGHAILLPFEITLMAVLVSTHWLSGLRRRRAAPPAA